MREFTDPASVCRLYTSIQIPSSIFTRMKVNPFGVKQSSPDASEHWFHSMRSKSIQSKLDRVFRPDPKGTPPLVAVRNVWLSYSYRVAW